MPGTLPVINRRAVELVMLTGLALGCHVETDAVRFERKNYFYPDLPKGYQISQYALPLTSNGRLLVPVAAEGGEVTIGITRAHLEEDTARMQHAGRGYSVVDFNRAGVPLMEIVTEPDIRSPAQARAYGETLRELLRAIGASNADMEAGSMRIEGNVSLRPMGATSFGTKVEVKNLNSFRSLERAHGVRGRAPRRGARSGRDARPGDAWLGRGQRPHDHSAQQGGGERLSLLPGAGSAAAPSVGRVGRGAARPPPRAAGAAPYAVHRRAWGSPPMTPAC